MISEDIISIIEIENWKITSVPLEPLFLQAAFSPGFTEFIILCFTKAAAGNNPVTVPVNKVNIKAEINVDGVLKISGE